MSKQALKYKEQGNAEFKKGNHAKAIEYYTYATELDPNNHIFFSNRATAYFTMGNYEKSLRDSNKAITKNVQWWKGHHKKIECLLKLNRPTEAQEAAVAAQRLFPDKTAFNQLEAQAKAAQRGSMSPAEWLKTQGNEHFKAGRVPEAIKAYSDALAQADTGTPEGKKMAATIYCNRAACNRQLYLHEKVVSDCGIAIRLDPTNVKAFIRRAQSLESMEKYAEALEDFQKATSMGGGQVASAGASRVRRGLAAFQKMSS
jgi:stress-induced-phosphoprotein 1